MSTNAAENHYNWRVLIGHHDRPGNWGRGCPLLWNQTGYGCLIHPRIVLTSLSVWKSAEGNRYGYDVFARVWAKDHEPDKAVGSNEGGGDQLNRKCKLGYADEARDLAALVLAAPFRNSRGKLPKTFPEFAEAPPAPGQVLCVLSQEGLVSRGSRHSGLSYTCFTFGSVSLLRSESEFVFALSGILTEAMGVGTAVFDETGKIYGVVTDHLEHFGLPERRAAGQGCFVVFSPVYNSAKTILRLCGAPAVSAS